MLPTIALDMDGTIASLYTVPKWLESITSNDATPYYQAPELVDCDSLNDLITLYKAFGGHVCIVSWLCKGELTDAYSSTIRAAKVLWLREHLPAIDDIRIAAYGIPKSTVVRNVRKTVLFDDELANRLEFERAGGESRLPRNIFRFMLARLAKEC